MLDIEAIWKGWQSVVSWFVAVCAFTVGAVLVERPEAAVALGLIGIGVVLLGIGRTLLHILEVLWLRRQD